MKPAKLALESFTEGDTWEGIPSLVITVNGSTPAAAIVSGTIRFKPANELPGTPVQIPLTLVNAAGWEVSVPPGIVAGLTKGDWIWRIAIIDASGVRKTYLADKITILETV